MMTNFKISTTNFYLFILCFFIIFGNLGRIGSSFNITEIAILLIFSLSFFLKKIQKRILVSLLSLLLLILLSMIVGIIKFSLNFDGISYSIRLIIQILSIYSIAYTLLNYEKNQHDFNRIINSYINVYIYLSIISIIILFLFPNSVDFWSFLSNFGIIIDGDPHVNRIVSTYFDPNFFGNILLLPFLLTVIQLKYYPSKLNVFKLLILAFTLIFTFSRSTIASMFLLIFLYYIYQVYTSLKSGKIQKNLIYTGILFLLTIPVFANNSYISERLVQRFSSTSSNDGSTMARIESYNIGRELFYNNPILGTGFNFTLEIQKKLRGGIGIDSSIQSILIGFGIIGSMFLVFLLFIFIVSIYNSYKRAKNYEREISFFYVIYLILSILFLSNFNQLLFYPFWMIPTLSFGIYLIIRKSHFPKTIYKD